MKRNPTLWLILVAVSTLAFGPAASAQSSGQAMGQVLNQFLGTENEAASQAELRSFNHYLQQHPDTARRLWEKPDRVNDPDFVGRHDDLREWMTNHPNAANALRENPQQFMAEERHFQSYDQDFNSGDERRGELAHFDWFLDSHPEIRQDLMSRPELATRDSYLGDHPALRNYLERHQAVRDMLRDHPREFMDREAQLARREHENQGQQNEYPDQR